MSSSKLARLWSLRHIAWYPILALAGINIGYQIAVSWHQSRFIERADIWLLILASFNQLVAYLVVAPAMQGFYYKAGIWLSGWRVFGLVSAGLAFGKIVPVGEYVTWRALLRDQKDGVGLTTQWVILFYLWMFSGLVVMFFVFEIATLLFYPNAAAAVAVGKLRYLPVGLSVIGLAALLLLRFSWVRTSLRKVAFDKLGEQAVSPFGIIRELKLGKDVVRALTFAALSTWLIEGITMFLCLTAVGLRVPWAIALFGFSFARLLSFLPIVPGGIGEIEVGCVVFFAAYGYPVDMVFTAAVLYRLIVFWPPLLAGFLGFLGTKKGSERGTLILDVPVLELHGLDQ